MKKDGGGLNAIDIEARIKANLAAWIPKAQKAKKGLWKDILLKFTTNTFFDEPSASIITISCKYTRYSC